MTSRDNAEVAVLAAVFLAESALDTILGEGVRPEHFKRLQHEVIFGGMLALRDQGHAIDEVTMAARFASPQSPVGPADIAMLQGGAPNLGNLRDYCRVIREEAWFDLANRTLLEAGDALARQDRGQFFAALEALDEGQDAETAGDAATEFMTWYEAEQRGWHLPFDQLTEAIGGGMNPGETSIIGSWSGFGKTFLLSQILRRCVTQGATVREYASEMHGPKRTARQLVSLTGIPKWKIEKKMLNADETRRVIEALKVLPYQTEPTAGWPVEKYCRALRRHKPDVAAIDTASNLPCSRVDEWDRAATMLADTAAQTGTHLIQVFQLNLERDKGKRPPAVARDLRFGGTFYARARNVLFLHRDQESQSSGDGEAIWRSIEDGHIRVDKATHGDGDPVRGFLPVTFNPKWLRFDELDAYNRALEAA